MAELSNNESRLCDYGCGQPAKFILKNGKHCCETSYNRCPAIKEKNSRGVKANWYFSEKRKAYLGSEKHRENARKGSPARVEKNKETTISEFRKDNPLSSKYIRYNLVNLFGKELRCSKCGLSEWQGKPIPLEVHHIDGDSSNNEINNLEFLCLNCHALTDTFRGRNINGTQKVSDEELLKALNESKSIRQALIKVNLSPRGGNYSRAYDVLSKKIKNNKE